MGSLIWIHEWVANSGLVDGVLAGDTTLCSIVGMLIGCVIGSRELKQKLGQD